MVKHFQYGAKEIEHLRSVDSKLGAAIEQIGIIKRVVTPDLFATLARSIVGQQISSKAQATIWERIVRRVGGLEPDRSARGVTPAAIYALPVEELQQCGISHRKANYIHSAAEKIVNGELDLKSLHTLTDKEVLTKLTTLNGVGPWTAEMLMLFSMQRPNILSWGDLAIKRGMEKLYQLPKIDRTTFNHYFKLYTPYSSVASLYLWEISTSPLFFIMH